MGKVSDKVRRKVAGGAKKAAGKAKEHARALRGAAKKRLQKSSVRETLTGAVRSLRTHYPFIDRVKNEVLRAFSLNDRKDDETGTRAATTRAARRTTAAKSAAKTTKRTRKKAA